MFLILQQTGVFNTDCCKWRKKPAINKTWHNFQTFFKEAHTNFQEDQDMTAQQASQFNANAIESNNPSQPDVTNAFEHLAAETASDSTAVVNLTTSNQSLSDALQNRRSEIHTANVANATLQQKVAKLERDFDALQAQFTATALTKTSPAPPAKQAFYQAPTSRAGQGQ